MLENMIFYSGNTYNFLSVAREKKNDLLCIEVSICVEVMCI